MTARHARIIVLALVLSAAAGGAGAGELVLNGGFETGSFAGWTHGAGNTSGNYNASWADHLVALDCPFAGDYSALLGFKYTNTRANRFGYMYQDVAVPSNVSRATLFFKFRQQGYDGLQHDPFRMQIRNTANAVLATVVTFTFSEGSNGFKDSGWLDDDGASPAGYGMTSYAGSTVRLYFRQDNLGDNLYETWAFVDDVSLVYRKFVDLAVDGAGDDLFGDVGTGAGGYAARSDEPAHTAVYLLDVENEGLDADAYLLTAAPPAGWSVSLRVNGVTYAFPWTTPAIAPGSKLQAEVLVTVPPGQATGSYSTIVDAISTAHGNRYDSALLATNVVPAQCGADLAIDGDGLGVIDAAGGGGISYVEADPAAQADYTIELHNTGVRADTFRIRFTAPSPLTAAIVDGGTIRTGSFVSALVDPGGSASYTLRVSVPAPLLGGDYTSYVCATSLTDTLRKDGVRAVTRVRSPKVDIVIGGSGDGIIDATGSGLGGSASASGRRGATVAFPFDLQNEGAVVDSFTLAWTPPGNGWTAVVTDGAASHALPWTTPAMAAFTERSYALMVTIAVNAAYETHPSILDAVSAVSTAVRESVSPVVTVTTGSEIDLTIDGDGENVYGALGTGLGGSSVKTAAPGSTVSFTIVVENESGENLFDLSWNTPAGWFVSIGDSASTMRGVTAGTYTLEARIPASCPAGTFDVVVDGVKTNKRYFVDSVRGRLLVTLPRVVDALVDGDGDETFGTAGSGAGGSSVRSAIAGQTVRFALELQNQGGVAESYRVSWNAFPGWTASLAGSASPFATPQIEAGASGLYDFEAVVPLSAAEGDYNFVVDVVSTADSTNVESVVACVRVSPPPRVDLVIDGDGVNVTAPAGTGGGGRALVFGAPSSLVTARLDVVNRGGFPDSFRVSWSDPAGWPAGSIVIWDGASDRTSPFVTALVAGGDSLVFTVKAAVPAGAALRSSFVIDGVGLSGDLEDSNTLEIATGLFVGGIVFNDRDHDGMYDAGEEGWTGVTVTLSGAGAPLVAVTDGASEYLFEVPAGAAYTVVETNPSGMISLTSDTVACPAAAPGETLRVDFADVRGPAIAPANDLSGPSGGFIDFPHVVIAGTKGQATLAASLPAGWIEVMYRDRNASGTLDAVDTLLGAADLALDPDSAGQDLVYIIVRVFVPPQVPAGTVASLALVLRQAIEGTPIEAEAAVADRILVLAQGSGLLALVKGVDLAQARPGDTLTYTIAFSNPGAQGVAAIEIIDPLAASVELVPNAFGPGRDIEWMKDGSPVYLTADPGDADEAMLEMPDGRLRVLLSRQTPYTLESGAAGSVRYRVRVR